MRPRTLFFCSIFIAGLVGAACGGSSGTTGGGGPGGAGSSTTTSSATTTTSSSSSSSSSSGCDPTMCPDTGTACITPACGPGGTCTTANAPAGTTCTDSGGKVCDGNGNCVACAQASDCPMPSTACVTPTCSGSVCGTTNAAQGTSCSDGGGTVCDGNGKCVQCVTDADCTAGATCDLSTDTCTTASCTDGIKDGNETDVDCGGPECDMQMRYCLDGKMCKIGGDCLDKVCQNDVCQPPSCTDGVQNGEETGVDCGGAMCDNQGYRCPTGDACINANDCQSLICDASNHCPAPTCTDGVQNGKETGVDCGNTAVTNCPPCGDGQGCAGDSDCQSMRCVNDVCTPASCHDGIQDGGESDVDCGHVCIGILGAGPCASGKMCVIDSDCESNVCTNGICM